MIRDNAPIKYDEIVFPVYTVVVRSFINFLFGRRGKILVMYLKKGEQREDAFRDHPSAVLPLFHTFQ